MGVQVFDGDGVDRDPNLEKIEGYCTWLHINKAREIASDYGVKNIISVPGMSVQLPNKERMRLALITMESWEAFRQHVHSMSRNWTHFYVHTTPSGFPPKSEGLHCQIGWAAIEEDGTIRNTWPDQHGSGVGDASEPVVTEQQVQDTVQTIMEDINRDVIKDLQIAADKEEKKEQQYRNSPLLLPGKDF